MRSSSCRRSSRRRTSVIRQAAFGTSGAVSIDTDSFPPEQLTLRGQVSVDDVDGVAAEYALAPQRYLGEEAGKVYIASIDRPGTMMARIVLRPAWVGLVDFSFATRAHSVASIVDDA